MKYLKVLMIMILITTTTYCNYIFNYDIVKDNVFYGKTHTAIYIKKEEGKIYFSYQERMLDGMLIEAIHQTLTHEQTLDDLVMCLTIEELINNSGNITYAEVNELIRRHWESIDNDRRKALTNYVNDVIMKYKNK